MTEKEFNNALRKGFISFENDKIKTATIKMYDYNRNNEVCLETLKNSEITFSLNKLKQFTEIFHEEGQPVKNGRDFLCDYEDKYLRVIIYTVPEEEMHQLSDKYEVIGLMNIVDDNKMMLI